MAASENPIVGVNLLSKIGGTLIGAQTDASLSASQDLREAITKQNSGFIGHLSGKQDWSVSHSGLVLNDSGSKFIANGNGKLELDIPDGSGGTQTVEVPRLSSIDLSLTQNLAETGGLDQPLWTYRRPAERSVGIDIEGSYLDPNSTIGAVYDEIWTAKDNSDVIPFTLTIASKTLTGSIAPGDLEIGASTGGEDATISVSFMADEQVTQGGTAFDSSVSMILDAFFNQTEISFAMEHQSSGTAVTGSTAYEGNGYLADASISIPDGEEVTMDANFNANGPLSRVTR